MCAVIDSAIANGLLKPNEGKVCDVIIQHLEAREGKQRRNLRLIEKHHASPVEMVCNIGDELYAFEHTCIEPFEGHAQLQAEAELHFGPICEAFTVVPSEVLELHIPAKAMQGMKKAQIHKTQQVIIEWIKKTAPTLPLKRYSDYIGGIKPTKLEGLDFEMRLFRFESVIPAGRFQVVHIVQEDKGQARTERIKRSCEKKFPKLAAWKKDEGAKTILIFEDDDIQLTNPVIVAETFLPLAANREDKPDETYMVGTCMNPWWMWPILIDNISYFDLGRAEKPTGWEILTR